MKKVSKFLVVFPLLGLVGLTTGCDHPSAYFDPNTKFIKGEEIIKFNSLEEDSKVMHISNNYSNNGMFASFWSKERVRYQDGVGYLSIVDTEDRNYGAEIRAIDRQYLYGYYGARMKVFKHSGTVQSLFTYNGGQYYEWDEIDIEFLGKDTTGVQFNYYSDGKGDHEHWHKLGFDASEDFHDYGFKWEENKITWFVDFVPVYAADATLNQWGHFMANVWASKPHMSWWTGSYSPTNTPLETAYEYLCYAPLE